MNTGADPLIPDDKGIDLFDVIRDLDDASYGRLQSMLKSSIAGASLRFFFAEGNGWFRFDPRAELALLAAVTAEHTPPKVQVQNSGSSYEVLNLQRVQGAWSGIRTRGIVERRVLGVERMIETRFSDDNEANIVLSRGATMAELEPSESGDWMYRAAKGADKLGRQSRYWEIVVTRPEGGLCSVGICVPGFEVRDTFWYGWEGCWMYGCSSEEILISPGGGIELTTHKSVLSVNWRRCMDTRKKGRIATAIWREGTRRVRATIGVLVDRSKASITGEECSGDEAHLSFFVNGQQVRQSIAVVLPDNAVPVVCLSACCSARFVSLMPPWCKSRAQPVLEPMLQAAQIMQDDTRFNALDEPLAPTAPARAAVCAASLSAAATR